MQNKREGERNGGRKEGDQTRRDERRSVHSCSCSCTMFSQLAPNTRPRAISSWDSEVSANNQLLLLPYYRSEESIISA